jgi:AcrR family transcriptional regulator
LAELAGVSVGSLYQYFPNKAAIVAELARRIEQRGFLQATSTLSTLEGRPIPEITRAMVGVLLSHEIGPRRMRRVLLEEVPPKWREGESSSVDLAVQAALHTLFAARPSEVRAADHELMAFVVYHAIEAVVEAALMRRPELLERADFADELSRLALGYLGRRTPAGARRARASNTAAVPRTRDSSSKRPRRRESTGRSGAR